MKGPENVEDPSVSSSICASGFQTLAVSLLCRQGFHLARFQMVNRNQMFGHHQLYEGLRNINKIDDLSSERDSKNLRRHRIFYVFSVALAHFLHWVHSTRYFQVHWPHLRQEPKTQVLDKLIPIPQRVPISSLIYTCCHKCRHVPVPAHRGILRLLPTVSANNSIISEQNECGPPSSTNSSVQWNNIFKLIITQTPKISSSWLKKLA